jgi:hypothetical protein
MLHIRDISMLMSNFSIWAIQCGLQWMGEIERSRGPIRGTTLNEAPVGV